MSNQAAGPGEPIRSFERIVFPVLMVAAAAVIGVMNWRKEEFRSMALLGLGWTAIATGMWATHRKLRSDPRPIRGLHQRMITAIAPWLFAIGLCYILAGGVGLLIY